MLRLISEFEITQRTEYNGKPRNEVFTFSFVNECEINSTWKNLTDTAKITFPKNVYVEDSNGRLFSLNGTNLTAGDNTTPIFLRGDKIKISLGYIWFNGKADEYEMNVEFEGFISKVNPRTPIELECEDYMYLLKNLPSKDKTYSSDLEAMIKDLVAGTEFDVKIGTRQSIKTDIGDFECKSQESVAQVLDRLRKDFHINSYIRRIETTNGQVKYELRCSGIVYYPEDQKDVKNGKERNREWVYDFQENIISDDLEYFRKDDMNIRIKAISKLKEITGTTKKGKNKTKTVEQIAYYPDEKVTGSLRTYHWINKTKAELFELAKVEYSRVNFTGFKGDFETFGLPSARHGDLIYLQDQKLTERTGQYLCRGVSKSFGVNGYRQQIQIDLRTDRLTTDEIGKGL